MKLLALIFLFGLAASTAFQNAWERERDNVIFHFMKGMKMAGPLREALGMPDAVEVDYAEDEIKTELGKKLKEQLDTLLEKWITAKEAYKEEWINKIQTLKEKLKDMHIEVSEKAKKMLEKVKDKIKNFFKELLEKSASEKKRAISQAMEAAENELNMETILEKVNEEFDEVLLERLKDSKTGWLLRELIKTSLNRNNRETRSLKEKWEKMKEYFNFKEKFQQFREWIKNKLDVLDVKGKMETLKEIARQIIDHSKQVSKEVAIEALEALKPYHEDMGELWNQLKETVKDILHKKE